MIIANPLYDVVFKYMLEDKKEYQQIIRRLCKAYSDANIEGAMDLEDDFLDELARQERENEDMKQELVENKKTIEESKKTIEVKDTTIEALKKELEALRNLLSKS